jgi:hypothetical protein
VARDIVVPERGRARLQKSLGVLLGEPLATALGLVRVADVRKLEGRAGAREQSPRASVTVVVGASP